MLLLGCCCVALLCVWEFYSAFLRRKVLRKSQTIDRASFEIIIRNKVNMEIAIPFYYFDTNPLTFYLTFYDGLF